MDLRKEARARSLQCFERERTGDICRSAKAPRTDDSESPERGHELRAVHERQSFLRCEPRRLETGGGERLVAREQPAVVPRLSLADERQRQMCKRREISARADGAATRNIRQDVTRKELEQQF